jgi:hypothetical protein
VARIVVLGCAGVGKTVFSRDLAEALGCLHICLDDVWNQISGETRLGDFRALLSERHDGQAWISDGNFSEATFDFRLPRATHIIWLERPRWLCLIRAALRPFEQNQAHRPVDVLKVLAFIWNFNSHNCPRIEGLIRQYGANLPVLRLASDAEVRSFLKSGFRKLIDDRVEGVGGEDVEQL